MNKALVFGAGNIGRGFIGQLFSQSGYEVVFADVDLNIIEALNRERHYPISIVANNNVRDIIVQQVRGINSNNMDAVAAEMLEIDLIATAVGVNALDKVSVVIANGLIKRWKRHILDPINIIICENMLNASEYMTRCIASQLTPEQNSIFHGKVGLVEASIGRMVPTAINEPADTMLRVFVEEYDQLPVDKRGFKGEIPEIINMIPYSPFTFYIHRKLFMHNMAHALVAYLGFIQGYEYIWQATADSAISKIVINAMEESATALSRQYDTPVEELMEFAEDLIKRFGNRALGDTVTRVARDPIRKLSAKDRLSGAAILCTKQGVTPVYISIGIAAAFLYDFSGDEEAIQVKRYIDRNGIGAAVSHFCSFKVGDKNYQLVMDAYSHLKRC